MADLRLSGITKKFGKTIALQNINFEVKDKEFFIIFGPAGAGKTTLLNMIAGTYDPDSGHVYMDGACIDAVEPEDRNVAMVFEDYALYPHLSVFDNIASPLRSPRYREPQDVLKRKVTEVAKTLKIDWLLDRNPSELSNGQRQRVGLGRALVRSPKAFLMDEPLTHLDAKLRHQMRAELKDMQKNLDTTTLYVTHDYLEALSLGDRILVLNNGQIEQIGTPEDIYYRPANEFVASSFGEPEINILDAELLTENGEYGFKIFKQSSNYKVPDKVLQVLQRTKQSRVRIGIRPKDVKYSLVKESEHSVLGTVYSFEPLGAKAILTVEVEGAFIRLSIPSEVDIKLSQEIYVEINIDGGIFFDANHNNLFAEQTEKEGSGFAWQT